jgi:hypothetical protein
MEAVGFSEIFVYSHKPIKRNTSEDYKLNSRCSENLKPYNKNSGSAIHHHQTKSPTLDNILSHFEKINPYYQRPFL